MRRILLTAAAIAAATIPAVTSAHDKPAAHTLPPCPASQVHVWMTWAPVSQQGPNGHYGPAGNLTCNPSPPQRLHIRYLPSSWTLAAAHNYCAGSGSNGAHTRWGGVANVCPDVDY